MQPTAVSGGFIAGRTLIIDTNPSASGGLELALILRWIGKDTNMISKGYILLFILAVVASIISMVFAATFFFV
jgi:hypothetical protein